MTRREGDPPVRDQSFDALCLARPRTVMISQRVFSDALTPLERSGRPLLRTWQRGAVHFQWRLDQIITKEFQDQQDQRRSRPLAVEK